MSVVIGSDSRKHLWCALLAAGPALTNVRKTMENAYGGYRYAPTEVVLAHIRSALQPQGVLLRQLLVSGPDGVGVVSQLIHAESSEWEETPPLVMPIEDRKGMSVCQSIGSSISYGRKYSALAIVGIAAEGEDNDGALVADVTRVSPRAEKLAKIKDDPPWKRAYPRRGDPDHGVSDDDPRSGP